MAFESLTERLQNVFKNLRKDVYKRQCLDWWRVGGYDHD